MMSKLFKDGDQVKKDFITYWIDLIDEDLHCLNNKGEVLGLMNKLSESGNLKVLSINNTGVFAYMIVPDFRGSKCLAEIIFYIRKESRGDLKLVKKYINKIEDIARENNCLSVKIGGNIGYNDDSFIKLLKRWGYGDDTVAKYLTVFL
jgi:hypothetical protein